MASWICPGCNLAFPVGTDCENCGKADVSSNIVSDPAERIRGIRDQQARQPMIEDELDEMVAKASRPTLATLFKRGLDQGLIKPTNSYAVPQP